jgi:hypothetical protein
MSAVTFRYQGTVQTAQGVALDGVKIYVCTQPNFISPTNPTIPPSPLATLYTDSTGTTQLANPVMSDGNGNFFFYALPQTVTLVVYDPLQRITTLVFPDIVIVTPGAGTVTSVGLTMPAEFTVSGSPVGTSGTLAVAKANEAINTVWAGPPSGPSAPPTFRNLVAADIPAGAGFGLAAANTVIAGPATPGSPAATPTARKLVTADMASRVILSFSATPTFDCAQGNSFQMTLTGNVTASSVINAPGGGSILFQIVQDGTGGRTFAWPANFKGVSTIAPEANAVSLQRFSYDGTYWRAEGPGLTTLS